MIQILPHERWPELKKIFDTAFDSDIPHASATIVADVDELTGEIKSFLVLETLIRLGQIYQTGEKTRDIFELLCETVKNAGVIVIADQPRYERLAEQFEFRHVPGKIYRRDV